MCQGHWYIPNTAEGDADFESLPKFEFEETTHDFGKVIRGEVVTYSFKFKNVGKSDLVVHSVTASCGCTATKYNDKPIKPGEESFISVTFDSAGRKGFQQKSVSIAANTQPNVTKLNVKAVVIIPEK